MSSQYQYISKEKLERRNVKKILIANCYSMDIIITRMYILTKQSAGYICHCQKNIIEKEIQKREKLNKQEHCLPSAKPDLLNRERSSISYNSGKRMVTSPFYSLLADLPAWGGNPRWGTTYGLMTLAYTTEAPCNNFEHWTIFKSMLIQRERGSEPG